MSLGELDSAVRLGLPILIVVMNDAGYGAEVHHFRDLGLPVNLALIENTSFAAIARAIGAQSAIVRSAEDLEQLKHWLKAPEGVMIVDCKINPQVEGQHLKEAFATEM